MVIFVVGVFCGIMIVVGMLRMCVDSVIVCVWLFDENVMMLCLCCFVLKCDSVLNVLWNLKVFMCCRFLYLKNICVLSVLLIVCDVIIGVWCVWFLSWVVVVVMLLYVGRVGEFMVVRGLKRLVNGKFEMGW